MEKHKKDNVEFRFYEKPGKEPVLALLGESWTRNYGEEGVGEELHFHNMAEIGYCYHGTGQVVLNKNRYNYADGFFTFIPHNYIHTTYSHTTSQWEFIFFDAEELLSDVFRNDRAKYEKVVKSIRKKAFVFPDGENPFVGNLILLILDLIQKKGNFYKEIIQGALFTILMQMARADEDTSGMPKASSRSSIVSALEYISRNYQEDIRISDLAQYCHLSESHFRRIFQTNMGMSPVEYLNLARVQAACDFMRKDDRHMEEIALLVGYQTMSTFNRNFKRITGTSPFQWKKKIDAEAVNLEHYHVRAKKGW